MSEPPSTRRSRRPSKHRSSSEASGSRAGAGSGAVPASARDPETRDPLELGREIALRQLSMGPRTRAQLATSLRRKGIPEPAVEAVLDRFEEVQLVDDGEFARQWVESRHHGRGLARRALAHELRQRGVEGELVKQAVAQVAPEDELAAARELVRRRAPGMARDDPQRRVRRLAGMLARKGYGPGVAMQAIREQLAADDEAAAALEAEFD
ncbi:regulatory protein RecX [Spongisporangium articulatum]|uniref:Regulatory protein RecX n=1 Tax=Spongisporangium articulatum TaxID=3362603 RepID=A0ABW8ANE4_9ACTN